MKKQKTAESLVWRSQWHNCCNQRTSPPASALPAAFGLTFMSNISSELQIPSRCGDVITARSTYHRAMERAHCLVLESNFSSEVTRRGFLLQDLVGLSFIFSFFCRPEKTYSNSRCQSSAGRELMGAMRYKCFCQLIFCPRFSVQEQEVVLKMNTAICHSKMAIRSNKS